MNSVMTFIALVAMLILFNRTFGWVRRAFARHRAQWVAQGFVENDPAHRLRSDSYRRIGMVAYLVSGMLLCLLFQESPLSASGPLVVMMSAMFAIFPACLAMACRKAYTELTHPYGEASIAIRTNQFHRAPQPLVPQGEHGTAQLETPAKIGLLSLAGWLIPARPIVADVKK